LRIDADFRRGVCFGIRDQAEFKAAAKDFSVANVLAAGEDAAFKKDGVDVGAAHAAEGDFAFCEVTRDWMPPAGQVAKAAAGALIHGLAGSRIRGSGALA
jgi:hypothetical protein